MRLLRSSGIRCGIVESSAGGGDDAQDLDELGALHIILVAENGALRVQSWYRDHFQERHVTRIELVEYITKMVRLENGTVTPIDYDSQLASHTNTGSSNSR